MGQAPTRIAPLIAHLVEARSGAPNRSAGAGHRTLDVFRAFERIGPPVTDHAEPIALRRGRLTLRVSSSAWLTELAMMESQIVRRLNAHLPKPWVEGVRLVLGNPRPRPRTGPAAPRTVTLGAADARRVAAWAAEVDDPAVREAFARAAATSLAAGPPPAVPYAGPPGPRVLPPSVHPEDALPESALTYGYGARSVDRWRIARSVRAGEE